MTTVKRRSILFILIFILLSSFATAGEDNHAAATLFARQDGAAVRAIIEVQIEKGWHLYHDEVGNPDAVGLPTVVTLSGGGVEWGDVRFPKPAKLDQPGLGSWIYAHSGKIHLYATGKTTGEKDLSKLVAKMDGQTCSDTSCVLYGEEVKFAGKGDDALFAKFPADLTSVKTSASGSASANGANSDTSAPDSGEKAAVDYSSVTFPVFHPRVESGDHGLAVWLLLAFVAGMLLNLMPCVLPVISIKILGFVQQAGESRSRIILLGAVFGAGMLVVFWMLAAAAIILGLNWGEQFQSQIFLVALISVIFAFSLSLLGVFELGVPMGAGAVAGVKREGLPDAFFKGMLATVLATPCSGPFLGSTLAWTLDQTPLTVFLIFTSLGLGMALPHVVLTASPRLLKLVPKPGNWMITLKQAMGFVLLATVFYLMTSLRQDLLLFLNFFLLFVALSCWAWGRFSDPTRKLRRRILVGLISLLIIAGGAHLSFTVLRGLFDPDPPTGGDHIVWEDFEPGAFKQYLADGRNVFLDFYAKWCSNCKYNDNIVFASDSVRKLLKDKNVVTIKADMTYANDKTAMLKELRSKLGGKALPYLAVFPADSPDKPYVKPDILSVSDVEKTLELLPDP